jgi:hypothetical protein
MVDNDVARILLQIVKALVGVDVVLLKEDFSSKCPEEGHRHLLQRVELSRRKQSLTVPRLATS